MVATVCAGQTPDGRRCRSWPIRGEAYCLWHSPEREEEAAEARRLGGLRRRREKAVSGAYDFGGLDSIASIRRILEIATIDTLGLDNSVVRSRTLISAAVAAAKLLETGELEPTRTSTTHLPRAPSVCPSTDCPEKPSRRSGHVVARVPWTSTRRSARACAVSSSGCTSCSGSSNGRPRSSSAKS